MSDSIHGNSNLDLPLESGSPLPPMSYRVEDLSVGQTPDREDSRHGVGIGDTEDSEQAQDLRYTAL